MPLEGSSGASWGHLGASWASPGRLLALQMPFEPQKLMSKAILMKSELRTCFGSRNVTITISFSIPISKVIGVLGLDSAFQS